MVQESFLFWGCEISKCCKTRRRRKKLGKTTIVEIISDISTRQHNFSSVSDTYALQLKLNNASRFYLLRYNLNRSHPLKKVVGFIQ